MRARIFKIVGWTAVVLLPVGSIVGSEVYYAKSMSPRGVLTVRDYVDRFGEPRLVRTVQRSGRSHYEFSGRPPSRWVLALPSAPPAYVFDGEGQFVTWCLDPGEEHRRAWPLEEPTPVEMTVIRERFGLR